MKINEIEYQKNYNIIGMQWEKIIARGTMEDGDNFQDCVKKLRSECDQSAQEKINSLYQEQETTVPNNQFIKGSITPYDKEGNLLHPLPEKTPEQAAQELIETATQSNIKWFKHLPEKYPQLKELYQQKLKELTQ